MTADNTNNLYFFGILPPFNITAEINEIKVEIAEKYHSTKALKSPPHITIIPPFFANDTFEQAIESKVSGFIRNCTHIPVKLNGFGEFNRKVIFIEMEKNEKMNEFYFSFSAFFTGLGFEITTMNKFFHPHVTVAFRDLSPENFEKAWSVFEKKEFGDSFIVQSVHLLKHTAEQWHVVKEFTFGG